VCGTGPTPLLHQTIGDALRAAAAARPDGEALVVVHQGARLTFSELDARTDRLASALLATGLNPGDRVGIWAPNCLEWVLVQFATAKAGLVLVCINPAYRTFELEYVLDKVGCRALIHAARFKSSDYRSMLAELAPELEHGTPGKRSSTRLPALETVVEIGGDPPVPAGVFDFRDFEALANADSDARLAALAGELDPDDAVNIQFTSGTTGSPKGATLTHFNILNNGFFVGEAMRFTEADRLCIPVPFYHCFGMVMGNLNCVTHRATMVVPNDAFDPAATLAAVEAERCTALYGVPTMFIAELGLPDFERYDLSTLRTGIMAGASCPIEVMRQVTTKMHMPEVTIAYGMTETSPVSFQSSTDDPIERRVTTVGRVHPHVEVKVVDEAGRVVPRGTPGELCTRGYSVMLGYWDDTERTAEALDEAGWMHTGDIAVLDADGYCNIVGRVKDMVIRGGENVYPREVEEFLYTHEAIADAAVFGVPDPTYGEQLCAWIRVRDGRRLDEEAIREFCAGRIAHYKVPAYVRFVDEFPMTVTGKIQKFRMRDAMIDELGLDEVRTA